MSTIPQGIGEQILFFENHMLQWATNQANIGISIQDVTDISNATTAARASFTASEQARIASRDATNQLSVDFDEMERIGRGVVRLIRAFAISSNNGSVYSLGGIPAPSPGGPLPPAPTPTNFTGLLNSDGHVELAWKSNIKGRMFFAIERQVIPVGGAPGNWENRGAVPDTKFLDTDVPPAADSVNYRVAARRGTSQSVFTDPVMVLLATPGAAVA